MNVQSTGGVSVNQTAAGRTDPEDALLVSVGTHAGLMSGFLAAAYAVTLAGRVVSKVPDCELSTPCLFKSKYYCAFALDYIAVFLAGGGAYHGFCTLRDGAKAVRSLGDRLSNYLVETTGCTPLAQESCVVKACACFGALWSVFAGRGLMHSLVGITNPFPDSVTCRMITAGSEEVFNDSILVVVGAGTGYLVGKGAEYAVEKACAGIDMAARGAASILASPDAVIEPG